MRIKIFFLSVLFVIGLCGNVCADTHAAESCSSAHVAAAIAAAEAGDIVTVAGNCTWSETVTVNKPITIQGTWNGSTGTTLTANGAMGTDAATSAGGFFWITTFNSATLARITGFRFEMTNGTPKCAVKFSALGALSTSIRIDGNYFNHGSSQIITGHLYGLIDNNVFNSWHGERSILLSAGSRANADASWVTMTAGTEHAIFIENNSFISDASVYAFDTQQGGKFVIRYNNFDYSALTTSGELFQMHPSDTGYWQTESDAWRATAILEFYNNTIKHYGLKWFVTARGGSLIFHDNTVTASPHYTTILAKFYEEEHIYPLEYTPSRTAWPAEDQIHNSFFWNNKNPTGSTITGFSIIYGNSMCTGNTNPYACCTGSGTGTCNFFTANKDYFEHAPCGAADDCTHGKETFVCADGITECNGASSSYPTDGETLATKGTMFWTATGDNAYYPYAPYTCPHPLAGAGTCDSDIAGITGYATGGETPTKDIIIALSGAGASMTTGTVTVNTGGVVNIPVVRHNGWNGAWSTNDAVNCDVSACSVPSEGASATCSVTVGADCTVTYTAKEKYIFR